MEQKDIKRLIKALIGVGMLLLLILIIKPQNYIKIADKLLAKKENNTFKNGCPVFYTPSQHGENQDWYAYYDLNGSLQGFNTGNGKINIY